ncbi:MAG: 3-phosphoshikimate 1-carboxyvinyltransferase [Kiritimatiellae bacterium]|nr:3-phosphoshikimate 1-carboxyvinyltransferase [Kiritimatiellia bacterium]
MTVQTTDRPLKGTVEVPGDKSLAHRVALFAALSEGTSEVSHYPDSGVTRAMRGALGSLGVPSSLENGVLRLKGNGFRPFPVEGARAFCGNSATTMRLLAGALAGTGSTATLDGSEGLRRRPMDRIVEPLRAMGADVRGTEGTSADGRRVACAPLYFKPAPLTGIEHSLGIASAQALSCLQIAALGATGESRFTAPGPVRDHTIRLLRAMGASIVDGRVAPLDSPSSLRPIRGRLPGDISSAAFLLVAAAIVPGSRITVRGVCVNPTRTGVLDILKAMGACVDISGEHEEMGEPVADVTLESGPLKAVVVEGDMVVRAIDEMPALAVAAAFAEGETVVRDARELRYKETDRIAAIVTQLRALGAEVAEQDDGLTIRGGTVRGGIAHANGDHRLAMSMAVCGLRVPVTVAGAEILDESFPSFAPTLQALCR